MTVRYKLSAELGDGFHWTVVDTPKQVADAVLEWCQEFAGFEGEGFSVATVEMSDEEVAALPEV